MFQATSMPPTLTSFCKSHPSESGQALILVSALPLWLVRSQKVMIPKAAIKLNARSRTQQKERSRGACTHLLYIHMNPRGMNKGYVLPPLDKGQLYKICQCPHAEKPRVRKASSPRPVSLSKPRYTTFGDTNAITWCVNHGMTNPGKQSNANLKCRWVRRADSF